MAGCTSTKTSEAPLVAAKPADVIAKRDASPVSAAPVVNVVALHPLDDATSVLGGRSVYFDYDSAAAPPSSTWLLAAHAKYLRSSASARVRLEGHTDERGGSEYNLALGQKRADAVRQALRLSGVADGQMESVSYGKEKPAAAGHDEAAWSKNRRVDIFYQAR
ncbi:MAG: peptidoglycan-associated lipoprotein Pal [Burkholderiales bacterium]|nr:peptidoglycan-associated lipoprotein Pal [Burkholderiales bacterium]